MAIVEVNVGTLGRARGLAGEIFVDVTTDWPELRFARGTKLLIDGREFTIAGFHRQGVRGVLRFTEVSDRTSAEALTGATLVARVDESESASDPDEFFDHQLVGLMVVTPAGEPVGTVDHVEHLGFQDTLAVSTPSGMRLVPFVSALVSDVDLDARTLTVNPIPGLLDEDGDER